MISMIHVLINHTFPLVIICYVVVGSEFSEDKFVAKVKMEIVVSKEQVY